MWERIFCVEENILCEGYVTCGGEYLCGPEYFVWRVCDVW